MRVELGAAKPMDEVIAAWRGAIEGDGDLRRGPRERTRAGDSPRRRALPGATPDAALRYGETPGWDSLAHMQLVGEIEDSFDVMLEAEDVVAMSSFDEAVRILGKQGVAFSD